MPTMRPSSRRATTEPPGPSPFRVIYLTSASLFQEVVVEVATEGLGPPHGQRKPSQMAYSKQVDLLEPIDMAEHLDKIELYLGQVCAIAGISKMQLDYWTNKAQIPTKGKKQRIYDMDAVETVMLIKQAKDKGLNLGAAIDAARRFRERQRGDEPS